ncbi:ThuA domain-containing protein [Rubritalea spongiae]|uniref:ThuA domain-containing protein n=1 Tax=Rubritalea spongiae TaxID=430797 RepID=A0ABW5E2W3_9BACT
MRRSTFIKLALATSIAPRVFAAKETGKPRKLILIAGKPSHPPMMHEFRAGTILLEKRLSKVPGLIVERHEMGWVDDEETFEDADAVVCFSDGLKRHPLLEDKGRLKQIEKLVQRGGGFGCMHFGVEVPEKVADQGFRSWLGGCYEKGYSCNPIWQAEIQKLPDHPITNGVQPFSILDEWYFNMRFAEDFDASGPKEIEGVKFTPILVAKPSDEVRSGRYVHPKGPYQHIMDAKGREEALMWSVERPDGGRGFGFTGGHFHRNWQNDDFRKTILNALCWISKVEVPMDGVDSSPVSEEEIVQNLDPKK